MVGLGNREGTGSGGKCWLQGQQPTSGPFGSGQKWMVTLVRRNLAFSVSGKERVQKESEDQKRNQNEIIWR